MGRQTRRLPKVDRPKVDRPKVNRPTTKRSKNLRSKGEITPGPNQCHPRVSKGCSCLPIEVLHSAQKKLGIENTGTNAKTLMKNIASQLGIQPTDQRSLLMSLPLAEEEKKRLAAYYLRPAMPEGWKEDPDMWLDSNNIRDVMKQYEEARPDFKFLGPYPIDFASPDPYVNTPAGSIAVSDKCLIGEMCTLDLKAEVAAGKKHIGIVYNLDPHYKNGSHWVANYINIPKKQCYYFDSYGIKPPKQIYKFMQWLGIQEPSIQLGWNGRRFQHSNSECGMYSMYFIDRMLAGEPFLHFCRRAPPDRFMLDMRDWMFST